MCIKLSIGFATRDETMSKRPQQRTPPSVLRSSTLWCVVALLSFSPIKVEARGSGGSHTAAAKGRHSWSGRRRAKSLRRRSLELRAKMRRAAARLVSRFGPKIESVQIVKGKVTTYKNETTGEAMTRLRLRIKGRNPHLVRVLARKLRWTAELSGGTKVGGVLPDQALEARGAFDETVKVDVPSRSLRPGMLRSSFRGGTETALLEMKVRLKADLRVPVLGRLRFGHGGLPPLTSRSPNVELKNAVLSLRGRPSRDIVRVKVGRTSSVVVDEALSAGRRATQALLRPRSIFGLVGELFSASKTAHGALRKAVRTAAGSRDPVFRTGLHVYLNSPFGERARVVGGSLTVKYGDVTLGTARIRDLRELSPIIEPVGTKTAQPLSISLMTEHRGIRGSVAKLMALSGAKRPGALEKPLVLTGELSVRSAGGSLGRIKTIRIENLRLSAANLIRDD